MMQFTLRLPDDLGARVRRVRELLGDEAQPGHQETVTRLFPGASKIPPSLGAMLRVVVWLGLTELEARIRRPDVKMRRRRR